MENSEEEEIVVGEKVWLPGQYDVKSVCCLGSQVDVVGAT